MILLKPPPEKSGQEDFTYNECNNFDPPQFTMPSFFEDGIEEEFHESVSPQPLFLPKPNYFC